MKTTILLIGTLHKNLTPNDELRDLLEEIKPTQLFVELPEINSNKRHEAENVSTEMNFAYQWARKHNIPAVSYDTEEVTLEDSVDTTSARYKDLSEMELEEARQLGWRGSNRKLPTAWHQLMSEYIDIEKWDARERHMLENIKKNLASSGTVLILTGAAHLDFFEKSLPNAVLPLRS